MHLGDKISFLPTDPCFKKLVEIFSDDLGELFSEKNNGYKKKDQKKDGNENESHEKDGHEKERNENFKVNRLLELMRLAKSISRLICFAFFTVFFIGSLNSH